MADENASQGLGVKREDGKETERYHHFFNTLPVHSSLAGRDMREQVQAEIKSLE